MAREIVNLDKLAEAQVAADAAMGAATLAAERLAEAMPRADRPTTFNTRLRLSSIAAIDARAREDGVSLKLVIARALEAYGIDVAPADLEDRAPRRNRMAA
jgi:hypothetical protein